MIVPNGLCDDTASPRFMVLYYRNLIFSACFGDLQCQPPDDRMIEVWQLLDSQFGMRLYKHTDKLRCDILNPPFEMKLKDLF